MRAHRVRALLMGGQACVFYGAAEFSRDTDFAILADAANLTGPARYDFITTFDSVHDQAHPDRMLAGIAAALRPSGVYLCVDVAASSNLEENMDHPIAPMMYSISKMPPVFVALPD